MVYMYICIFSMTTEVSVVCIHFSLQAMDITQSPSTTFIPEVHIPLYPRRCMCNSMDKIAQSVQFSSGVTLPIQVTPTCTKRPACDGINCDFGISGTTRLKSHILIEPCSESVRIIMVDLNNVTQFDHVYNDSDKYSFDVNVLSGQLYVGIEHHNFSMQLSVSCV